MMRRGIASSSFLDLLASACPRDRDRLFNRLPALLALLALGAALVAAVPPGVRAQPPLRVVPGEVLVLPPLPGSASGKPGSSSPALTASSVGALAARAGLSVASVTPIAVSGGGFTLRYTNSLDPGLAAALLAEDPSVGYAGPNHVLPFTGEVPDDPWYSSQTELHGIGVPEAWESTRGAGILIAIVDTGLDLLHPDLVGRLAVNEAEAAGEPGVDDDGNGYVDDVHGFDFTDAPGLPGVGDYLDRDGDPQDDYGHGTSVAGVAAATRNNGEGIAGVAPEASLLAVRAGLRTSIPLLPAVLEEDDAAAGVIYAADNGAHIINLSFGDVVDAPVLREAVRHATDRGVLVVASSGNQSNTAPFFPSAYPRVFSIGASTPARMRAPFSVFGTDLDLLAPGVGVLAPDLSGGYNRMSGTSFSSPISAGAAALVWSLHPEWTADQVIWRLKLTADREQEGWDFETGWGILNVAAAVAPGEPPPVVEMTRLDRDPLDRRTFHGTVAGADLVDWELVLHGPGGERVDLAAAETGRRVDEPLAHWNAVLENAKGTWEAVLRARFTSHGALVDWGRIEVGGRRSPPIGLETEVQAVGGRGWDVRVSWETEEAQQGAVLVRAPGARVPWDATNTVGFRHVARARGPIPAGTWPVEVLGRGQVDGSYAELAELEVTIPSAPVSFEPELLPVPGSGTPLPVVVDFDRDFRPEIVIERPPVSGFYGRLGWFELDDGGALVELDDPPTGLLGIPRDAADADGDGLDEMILFQLGRWEVWEQHATGDFPNRRRFSAGFDGGNPLGFAEVAGGTLLLAVRDTRLLAFDPADDYAPFVEAEAAPGASFLRQGGAVGDFDGDGDVEVVLADDAGRLQVFGLSAAGAVFDAAYPAPGPLLGSMLAVRSAEPERRDLLTLEFDPQFPEEEGDFKRTATRVRRWIWNGTALIPAASLAFTGIGASGNSFLADGDDALLYRAGTVDRLVLAGGDVVWGGRVLEETGHDAGVLVPLPGTSDRLLWSGASEPERTTLARLAAEPAHEARGPALRVTAAAVVEGRLALALSWTDVECGPPARLLRANGGTETELDFETGAATDTLVLGTEAEYRLEYPGCAASGLQVRAETPAAVHAWWDAGRLVLDLDRPLLAGREPGRFLFFGAIDWPGLSEGEPLAVEILRGGTRLVLAVPPINDYDELRIEGLWDVHELPVGGKAPLSLGFPPRDLDPPELVLVAARYEAAPPRIEVTLNREADPGCTFVLDPGGRILTPGESAGTAPVLPLDGPLTPGTYRLRLDPSCSGGASLLATTVEFRLGFQVYPNPVRAGESLTIENLHPETALELVDPAGRSILRETVSSSTHHLDVTGVAPGLYFLRTVDGGGRVHLEKVAIIQ